MHTRGATRSHPQAGAHREAAISGPRRRSPAGAPDDVELLVLAGRAGVELDAEDATEQLRRATELAPEHADAWHYLGEALATEGRTDEADDAFRRAVELNPADQVALSHLGHTSAATGREEEAVGYLSQAAQSMRGASTAAISLVDMYRTLGHYEEALAAGAADRRGRARGSGGGARRRRAQPRGRAARARRSPRSSGCARSTTCPATRSTRCTG